MSEPKFAVAQLDEITPTPCPCGQARRAFKEPWNTLATVHLTDIHADSKAHWHEKMTEIYIVLEGEGHLEADGQIIPLKPMTAVMIRPGCVHRAVGKLRIINVPMPPFDPADEFEVRVARQGCNRGPNACAALRSRGEGLRATRFRLSHVQTGR